MPSRILLPIVCVVSLGCGSSSSGDAAATSAGAGGTAGAGGSSDGGSAMAGGSAGTGGDAAGTGGGSGGALPSYDAPGPAPVGHTTFVLTDSARGRALPVEVWYPADESARALATTGTALEDLEPAGPHHDALAPLVAAGMTPCVRKRTASAADAPVASGTFPLIAFSHCSGCTRYTSALLAEHLASRGFAVIAPDHVGNTLWDAMAGMNAAVDAPFLATRAGDIRFVVDQALDAANADFPAQLRGRFDGSSMGVYGHSFGALTTGLVLDQDPRFLAGFAIAAPMQLLDPTRLADIHAPVFFLLAKEDHSINEVGNNVIRGNFMDANPPAWLAEVEDAGHYSFTDVAGLVDSWSAGCGPGKRQTGSHDPFTYLDNDVARGLAAGYVAAFFERHLRGDAAAGAYLGEAHPAGTVTVSTR